MSICPRIWKLPTASPTTTLTNSMPPTWRSLYRAPKRSILFNDQPDAQRPTPDPVTDAFGPCQPPCPPLTDTQDLRAAARSQPDFRSQLTICQGVLPVPPPGPLRKRRTHSSPELRVTMRQERIPATRHECCPTAPQTASSQIRKKAASGETA